MCVPLEARGEWFGIFYSSQPCWGRERGLLLNLKLAIWSRLASEFPGSVFLHITTLGLQTSMTMSSFYVGTKNSNLVLLFERQVLLPSDIST